MRLILVSVIFLVLSAGVVYAFRRNGWNGRRLWALSLFFISLLCAWLLQQGSNTPLTAQYIPFYKLTRISEYGYQSILTDLCERALIFLPAGFFLVFAFPGVGTGIGLLLGATISFLYYIPMLLRGVPFQADVIALGALGMAAGAALVEVIAHFIQRKEWFPSTGLAVPSKKKFFVSFGLLAVIYFGIALVMIADYGTTYGELYFYRGETPLPEEIVVETELDSQQSKADIYSASDEDFLKSANRIAGQFGMSGTFTEMDNSYAIASPEGGMLTFASDGSWTYTFEGSYLGDVPDLDTAEQAARDYLADLNVLGGTLGDAIDRIEKNNEQLLGSYDPQSGYSEELYQLLLAEAQKTVGADLYFRLEIDGHPIVGSNEIMVSVRAGNTITRIRKNDPDLVSVATKNIISPQQGWDKLLAGEGAHTLYEPLSHAVMTGFELAYMLETAQGYYLPIWCYSLEGVNQAGETVAFEAYVSAMK